MSHCKVISPGAVEAEYKDFYRPASETLGYILIMNCQIKKFKSKTNASCRKEKQTGLKQAMPTSDTLEKPVRQEQ